MYKFVISTHFSSYLLIIGNSNLDVWLSFTDTFALPEVNGLRLKSLWSHILWVLKWLRLDRSLYLNPKGLPHNWTITKVRNKLKKKSQTTIPQLLTWSHIFEDPCSFMKRMVHRETQRSSRLLLHDSQLHTRTWNWIIDKPKLGKHCRRWYFHSVCMEHLEPDSITRTLAHTCRPEHRRAVTACTESRRNPRWLWWLPKLSADHKQRELVHGPLTANPTCALLSSHSCSDPTTCVIIVRQSTYVSLKKSSICQLVIY
jgi:hypothetical protein